MSEQSLPEIRLELNSGTFKIRTPEAIYIITVHPAGTVAREIARVVEHEVDSEVVSAGTEISDDREALISVDMEKDPFYKEVSVSMLKRIGQLAKRLNISLKNFSVNAVRDMDLDKSGRRLADAMGQLEEINIMAEKATMAIMDLTEKIQEDIRRTKENIKVLNEIDLTAGEDVDSVYEAVEEVCGGLKAHQPVVDEIVSSERMLLESITELSDIVCHVEEREDEETPHEFDLDTILQTLYECCTNESVKERIETMRNDKKACDTSLFYAAMNESLKEIEIRDNFADIPITLILASLSRATDIEKYQGFLEDLGNNLSSFFLEENLSFEFPQPQEASDTAGEGSSISELVSNITNYSRTNLEKLQRLKTDFFDIAINRSLLEDFEDKTIVKRKDRDTIKKILNESNVQFSSIMDLATKIFENLSFQDLSGQKIEKIINMLNEFQSQLFVMLVALDAQIKTKEENKDITAEESEKLVQQQVDRVLAEVTIGGEDEDMHKRFDQDAVNRMLESMGF